MGCLSQKVGFKRSALDMGKIRVFIVQKLGFPNGELGKQIDGVTETEHKL